MRVTLVEPAYLTPSLMKSLTDAGFLVGRSGDGALDVLTPWVPDPTHAAARVAAEAHAWAALHGAEISIDPAPRRFAYPLIRPHSEGRVDHDGLEPTVSIGLPVYNGGPFLEEALESLAAQTFGDIEIIVCDNGSTDGTQAIAQAFARRDERVSFHPSGLNRGAAWNYNRALALARGRYFKWASHDDICAPTFVERCVEVLDRTPPSVVLTYPKTVIIDEQGERLRDYEDGLDLRQTRPHARVAALIRNIVMSNAVFGLIRTDVLRRTRQHGSYISADYVLLAELALAGQFWEIPEQLFFRREHQGMSRAANRTAVELAEWFRPGTGTPHTTEFLRLFVEYLKAIRRADLARGDRLAVYATTVPLWLKRFRRGMGRELLRELARPVRGNRHEHEDSDPDVATPPPATAPVVRSHAVPVHELVRRVAWQVAPDFMPHIRIRVEPSLTILGDDGGLEAILSNLISNAVRYGDVPIAISAEATDRLVLTVDDSGRGVDSAFVPRMFEAFTRSEQSRSSTDGAGLGLAVARMTAEAIGGSLVYEPLEIGARFRLVFPGSVLAGPKPGRPGVTEAGSPAVAVRTATRTDALNLARAA